MTDAAGKTLLVMAGGTGGHVYPALAVAQAMRMRGWAIEWLGTREGIEARVGPANGIPLHVVSAVGLRGKSWQKLLVAPWHLLRAWVQALSVFRRARPAVVLGMGGFASVPGGLCAVLLRVPLVIHEQNAVAGTANRLLARIATRVLSAFPAVLPGCEQTGNPVRQDIAALATAERTQPESGRPLRLLVLGGSQGARALNQLVPEALSQLPAGIQLEVFHQAGPAMLEETRAAYQAQGLPAQVEPFIEDMASRYAWADLAICRAGAMTVSELACAQLPALLVPFPFAIDDHQTANARWLVDAGAARLLPQASLAASGLAQALAECLSQPARLADMARAAHALARPDAAMHVATICEQAQGRRKQDHVEK